MPTKSEKFTKYGLQKIFEKNTSANTENQENFTINESQIVYFKTFLLTHIILFFVLT